MPASDAGACLDADRAARFAEGVTGATERDDIARHLATCDPCREWIAALASAERNSRARGEPSTEGDGVADPLVGVVVGRYRLIERLGGGSTGLVYRASDPVLHRDVAVKVVRFVDEPAHRHQLVAEARAMAQISHASVVPVFDAHIESDEVYVATAWVEGGDLRSGMRGSIRARPLLSRFADLADGLAAIHDAGFVHRDVKPDNILVDPSGHLLLADLGLRATANPGSRDDAAPGASTPAYCAPEVRAGDEPSAASDQYAFAITFIETILGERPECFDDALAQALRRAGVRRAAVAALRQALDREPSRRHASMRPLRDAFRAAGKRRARRTWAAVVAASIGLLALAAVPFLGSRAPGGGSDPCARGAEQTARWREAEWDARLAGAPSAAKQATVDRIEQYAARWAELHRQACEAAADDVPGAHARLACLEQRAHSLSGFLAALESVDPELLEDADESVWSLPPVEACVGESATWSIAPPPPTIAPRVVALRAELARVRAEVLLADYPAAASRLEQIEEAARSLGYAPLSGEARYVAAALDFERGNHDAAGRAFEEAAHLAERGGHDRLRAKALSARLRLPGLQPAQGAELMKSLEPLLERFAEERDLAAQIHERLAGYLLRIGRYQDARTQMQKASELLRELGEGGARRQASMELNLGTVTLQLGDKEGAERHYRSALELYRSIYRDDHPRVAFTLGSLAAALGDDPEAVALHDESVTILRSNFGDEHPDTLQALSNSCSARSAQHRPDALDRCREAVAAAEGLFGEDHVGLVWPLTVLGQALIGADRPAEAQAELERAFELADPQRRLELADVQYYLAAALAAQRTSPGRALELARAARATWAKVPSRQSSLAEIDRLVAEIERTSR